ncbi:hypothetical protein J3A83DRAFT_4097981, partial [Scleroderma citrinum]
FPEGHGFKQWTGNDCKALMKVYLPAIAGYVPNQMVHAIAAFLDFCYIIHQSSLNEADLDALDNTLQHFATEDVHSDGISVPQIHALKHYHEAIQLFGAPYGISTSIRV